MDDITKGFVYGLISSLTITSTPLYRYPFRSSAEAFRGDWKRIGGDIDTVIEHHFVDSSRGNNHE